MTPEQREARKISAESGKIKWIKDNCLRTKDGEDDYVFISYKSDDYEKVLDGIVYDACKKYGLKVYFDTAFDDDSDSWITQFYKNMCSIHCKAMIAFLDDAYYSSYATLIEMMARRTKKAGGDLKKNSLFFLPINLGVIREIQSEDNTGLGTERYSNGTINNQADKELKLFNRLFKEVTSDSELADLKFVYERFDEEELYCEKTDTLSEHGEVYLNVSQCREIMKSVCPKDNGNDGKNKAFVEVIHDKLVNSGRGSVFGKIVPSEEKKCHVSVVNGEKNFKFDINEGDCVPAQDAGIREGFEFVGWFLSNTDEEWNFSNPIYVDMEICAKWEAIKPDSTEGYKYTIFGEPYEAGSREQGKLMFDAFEVLAKRYPECVDFLTKRTSVARAEDVKKANTPDADPTYFRGCKEYEINGIKYLVGTSYGFKVKIAEIKGMFKICGADVSEFVLNGEPLKSIVSTGKVGGNKPANDDVFEYELYGNTYTANKMVDMLNDVFDFIAEKYPEKIHDIAVSDKLTAVARKADLEQETANRSKIKQFNNYKGKEHSVNGEIYCVNAGYNREGAIKQIEKMLMVCGIDSNEFKIIKAPEKSSHTGSKSNKKGIGEILD